MALKVLVSNLEEQITKEIKLLGNKCDWNNNLVHNGNNKICLHEKWIDALAQSVEKICSQIEGTLLKKWCNNELGSWCDYASDLQFQVNSTSQQTWEMEQQLMHHSHHSHRLADYNSLEVLGCQPHLFDTGSERSELWFRTLGGVNSPTFSQVVADDGEGMNESAKEGYVVSKSSKELEAETLENTKTALPLPMVHSVVHCSHHLVPTIPYSSHHHPLRNGSLPHRA